MEAEFLPGIIPIYDETSSFFYGLFHLLKGIQFVSGTTIISDGDSNFFQGSFPSLMETAVCPSKSAEAAIIKS